MTLISRISRLFRADIHAFLDHMEEPDVLLRQAVREMEEELEDNHREITRTEQEIARLEKQASSLQEQLGKLEEEISLCLESGNEILAKTFIRRKLQNASLSDSVTASIQNTREYLQERKQKYVEQQRSFESIRQKAELVWREQQVRDTQTFSTDYIPTITEDDVELALIQARERFRQTRSPANATAKEERS